MKKRKQKKNKKPKDALQIQERNVSRVKKIKEIGSLFTNAGTHPTDKTEIQDKVFEKIRNRKKQKKQQNPNGTLIEVNHNDVNTKKRVECMIKSPDSSDIPCKLRKKMTNGNNLPTTLCQQSGTTNLPKNDKPIMTLRQKMLHKLKAARFRFLNEQIYKTNSKEAAKIFKKDPEAYRVYHEGYRQQVSKWQFNPVDKIIDSIKKMSKKHIIADFGCGDAKLAKSLEHKVHSFDLVSSSELVTACDMAHVPLLEASIDVAVFCLSLMGTNLKDYLLEANRVLKVGGILKIAEIESRFEDVDVFIKGLTQYGFKLLHKDLSNNIFYFLDFKKQTTQRKNKLPNLTLLPCLYKKR